VGRAQACPLEACLQQITHKRQVAPGLGAACQVSPASPLHPPDGRHQSLLAAAASREKVRRLCSRLLPLSQACRQQQRQKPCPPPPPAAAALALPCLASPGLTRFLTLSYPLARVLGLALVGR
jgi:hypothetical protein